MALVPLPPALPPLEDTAESKPVHHINRRKGHEKIMLDLLKRKIIRKGMSKTEDPAVGDEQNNQDNNTATK